MPLSNAISWTSRGIGGFVRSNVAELPKNAPERTGNRLRKERYYRKFRAPRGALRSCPAGLIAEVGLRWCGARPSSTNRFVMCGADGVGFNPDFDEGNVGTIVLSRDSMKK